MKSLIFTFCLLCCGFYQHLTSAFTKPFSRLPIFSSEPVVSRVPLTLRFDRNHRQSTKICNKAHDSTEIPDYETLYLKDAFEKLSTGQQNVKFDAVLKWPVVQQLFDLKVIDKSGLKSLFEKSGAERTDPLVLDFTGFVRLVKMLDSVKSNASVESAAKSESTVTKVTDPIEPRQTTQRSNTNDRDGVQTFDISSMFGGAFPANGRFIVSSFGDQDARIVQGPGGLGSIMDELMNIFSRSGRLSGGVFRPGASRTEIDVWKEFHRIARGRLSIGYEDLVNWTIVRSLLSNNQLSESTLQSIVQSRSGGGSAVQTRSGIDADCFERIVNDIVDAAGQTTE